MAVTSIHGLDGPNQPSAYEYIRLTELEATGTIIDMKCK
jgi:hypothetical protein